MVRTTNKRKALSILFALAMIVSMLAGLGVTASAASGNWTDSSNYATDWYTEGSSPYVISTAADFAGLAAIVNGTAVGSEGAIAKDGFLGKTVVLNTSIDLSAHYWTPIGTITLWVNPNSGSIYPSLASYGFAGTFNGGEKLVEGMTISTDASGVGLFAYLEPTGVINDLFVNGSVTISEIPNVNRDAIAGVVGYNSGTINKVFSSVTVSAPSAFNVGGITGFNNAWYQEALPPEIASNDAILFDPNVVPVGIIMNSGNEGNVTGYSVVGGIAGQNAGAISSCSNTGDIWLVRLGNRGVGGIAGRNGNNNQPAEAALIKDCYNTGHITAAVVTPTYATGNWVGGIAGFNNLYSIVDNVYNTGSLTGNNFRNSIIGNNEGTSLNGYSLITVSNTSNLLGETGIPMFQADMQHSDFVTTLNANASVPESNIWYYRTSNTPGLSYVAPTPTVPSLPPSGGNNFQFIYIASPSEGGNDANSGGNDGAPVATLAKAIQLVSQSTWVGGASVVVMDTISVSTAQGNIFASSTPVIWIGDMYGESGPMFDITSGGSIGIGGMIINGNGVATAFNVAGGLTVRNNSSISGCATAINVASGGTLTLNQSTISGTTNSIVSAGTATVNIAPNQTLTMNGTVKVTGGTFNMTNGTITGATVTGNGGGVLIESGGTFNMSGGTITGNTATYGGGVYIAVGGILNLTGGTIEDNTATLGQGIYAAWTSGTTYPIVINPTGVIDVSNTIYLQGTTGANGARIDLLGTLTSSNTATPLKIQVTNPVSTKIVARAVDTAMATNSLSYFNTWQGAAMSAGGANIFYNASSK